MKKKYAIGLDYGSLSLRGLLVQVEDGMSVAEHVSEYASGILEEKLPGSDVRLPDGFALQNPMDYIHATYEVLSKLAKTPGVDAADIIGIGLDSTACTIMPVDEAYWPLCLKEEFAAEPHAWIKLWKHHSAQDQADRLNRVAQEMDLSFLKRMGGGISGESGYPKILETLECAPEVYAAAHRFMEVGDWIVWLLTGKETRNDVVASFHMQWDKTEGFPPNEFFRTVHPGLDGLIDEKIGRDVQNVYERAGVLLKEVAEKTGLRPGISVCCNNGDGNTPLNCLQIHREGVGALILGTSSVLMFLTKEKKLVKGCVGAVDSALLPGYYGHVFGQSAAGDALAWYMDNMLPHRYWLEAEKEGCSVYAYMDRKIAAVPAGSGGVVALDWFNGCRSLLMNARLSSVLAGVDLRTKPEEIYRAIIEALAFGYRNMLDACAGEGIYFDCLRVCGGFALKNPGAMQVFSDVLGLPLEVSVLTQAVCLGSAISGAAATPVADGGWGDIVAAGEHMACREYIRYIPNPANSAAYAAAYAQYRRVYAFFGEESGVMDALHALKAQKG